MVLAFCRRGSVIPIFLYLLVGRYMKERISGLRNESSKTKRTGLFQRCCFPTPFDYHIQRSLFHFLTKSLSILAHQLRDRRDYGGSCSPRNDSKLDLGLFEIVPFNRNQRCFLVSRFFSEQIEEPNGSNSSLAATKDIGKSILKLSLRHKTRKEARLTVSFTVQPPY